MSDKYQKLKDKMLRKYENLPKMDGIKCDEACRTGKCKFECCTVSGCTRKEQLLINKFIKRNKLDLPMVKTKLEMNYILPNTKFISEDIEKISVESLEKMTKNIKDNDVKCAYLGENGCKIYEVRPAICRLFGVITQMKCHHFPEEARVDMPANEILINF